MNRSHDRSRDRAPRSLSDLDPDADPDVRQATLWRTARLGPTVERLRRHVLQGPDHTIDAGQFRALDVVAGHGPCTIGEVASHLGVDPATATRSIARLERDGFVVKTRSEADRRSIAVDLTDAGRDEHRYFANRAFEVYDEIFAGLAPGEKTLFADFLERTLKATDVVLSQKQGHND